MKVDLTISQSLAPDALAKALANATPEEFASFWLFFSEATQKRSKDLAAFAKAMSPDQGGNAKKVLRSIVADITYYERVERLSKIDTPEDD